MRGAAWALDEVRALILRLAGGSGNQPRLIRQ